MMTQPLPQLTGPARQDDDEIELATYFDILWESRWLIATITLVAAILGLGYAFMAKPVYESNLLIQVEEESQKDSKNILGDLANTFDVKTSASSEMELLRSRMVVSRAIDNLRLYINAGPKYFPVVGSWLAKHNNQVSNPGLFGFGGYAWGNEKIDIGVFNVPDALQNQPFVLTVEPDGEFLVSHKKENIEFRGKVGTPSTVDTPKGPIELRVDRIAGKPGVQFTMSRGSRLATIEGIQKSLTVAEQGAKQSGVIGATLQGSDPQMISSVLNEIAKEYIKQNAARKTEEAEKSLAYLNKQLPELRTQLEQSEARYNAFRNANGTVDLTEESKLSLQHASQAKLRKMELQQKRLELMTRFMPEHPAIQGIDTQLKEVNAEINQMNDHIKQLPMLEQNLLRLSREVKVNTDMYTQMLNTAQQLRLITVGKVSNVRLIDTPMAAEKPTKPNRSMIVALAVLGGLFLGVLIAFFRKSLQGAIDSPEQLERVVGLPVYATIPHSKKQKELYERVSTRQRVPLLANVSSTDAAVESLRNFRTALQFSMPEFKNNVVVITGATPGMGKSFVSANLAAVMAASGKKVLLIDSDLRNGLLHLYFGFGRQDGLSEVIAGTRTLEQVIHHGVIENMDFISTGMLPPNPAELLLRPNFAALFQAVAAQYDLVLVDAPPVLAVADTMIIGQQAGAIYITTRAGVTTPGEINETMKRLAQAGLAAKGVVFNDLKSRPGRYGYGYSYGYGNSAPTHSISGEQTPLIEAPTVR